jgi:hypothetical protein
MEAIFISFAKTHPCFTPFSGEWATRKLMFCRKIFRAVVGPFEVKFCRRDGRAADLFGSVARIAGDLRKVLCCFNATSGFVRCCPPSRDLASVCKPTTSSRRLSRLGFAKIEDRACASQLGFYCRGHGFVKKAPSAAMKTRTVQRAETSCQRKPSNAKQSRIMLKIGQNSIEF